ncbi:MAG: DegV family protein [Anaerotignum sp.]|nr:DegV family protein [Anaerotignum sp.]MBO5329229.1 DegV family protein [Anaerotignum sp.]
MVKIITDSSTLYTPEEGKKLGFDVMPLCVSIADLEDRDLMVDMDVFYGKIAEGNHPRSSQPPVGEVMDAYEAYPEDEIINIAMADGLSGTYHSACGARESVDNKENIVVFNSKTLCGPHRYMVEKAQKMAEEGKSAKEILSWLEYASEHHESFLIPQDFDFLRRGGRLTPVAAAFGSVLKLKPIMKQTDDGKKLDKFGVKRTMKAVVAEIIEHLKKADLDSRHVLYVSHARVPEDAKKVVEQLKESFPEVEYQILDLGAAFVTQGGPGCIAIQYIEK